MSELVWFPGALGAVFNSPIGPVAKDLARRALAVESAAKVNASHPPPSVRGSGPAVQSGRLRASITWQFGHDAYGLYVDVGTGVEYAPYLEDANILDRPFLKPALSAGSI